MVRLRAPYRSPGDHAVFADLSRALGWQLINPNKYRCAMIGTGAVRGTVVISDVITRSCRKTQHPSVLVLNDHLP